MPSDTTRCKRLFIYGEPIIDNTAWDLSAAMAGASIVIILVLEDNFVKRLLIGTQLIASAFITSYHLFVSSDLHYVNLIYIQTSIYLFILFILLILVNSGYIIIFLFSLVSQNFHS